MNYKKFISEFKNNRKVHLKETKSSRKIIIIHELSYLNS